MDVVSMIATGVAIVAAIAAVVGLFYQGRATKQTTKVMELQLLESIFKDIRSLEKDLYNIPDNYPTNRTDEKKQQWRNLFFQTLEFFCFLVNENYMRDQKIVEFFKRPVLKWYKGIFLLNATENEKRNPEIYPEIKKFWEKNRDFKI